MMDKFAYANLYIIIVSMIITHRLIQKCTMVDFGVNKEFDYNNVTINHSEKLVKS